MNKLLLAGIPLLVLTVVGPIVVAATVVTLGTSLSACPITPKTVDAVAAGEGAVDMDATQWKRASQIVETGLELGISPRGIQLALGVARQESGFRLYANDGLGSDLELDQSDVSTSLRLPHDAVGSDHGSLGLFQQQYPWWGSVAQLMDPAYSARKFYTALLRVPGWQQMPFTQAAATVQRPASAYRDAYADDAAPAQAIYAKVTGSTGSDLYMTSADAARCATQNVAAQNCAPTGSAAEAGLTPDALLVLRCVDASFGSHTYLGVGERSTNPTSDHPTGRAVDVMIDDWKTPNGIAEGTRIANWVRKHADQLGVTYVVWRDRIWSPGDERWQPYDHPAGDTSAHARHLAHVHVSVHGNQGTGLLSGQVTYPVPATATGSDANNWGDGGASWSSWHTGTDFSLPCGTPVLAAHAGTVQIDTTESWAGPQLVKITQGPRALTTWYAHMQTVLVAPGQTVQLGQQIGEVGAVGNATGCHLHFEVHLRNGGLYGPDNVDPTTWLAENVHSRAA